ncbi:hypothetical protein C0966_00670 [Bacillus methanolicus]|uniref:hypothetical protein n=1 Tax=Bacillus methanolicus TaxID=1471 RepID=UPI002380A169|nr:hypothetical protein [Bacillus methanolicus]MDE3837921.1 hypothetical protein [Bacillus methanolicus]
MKIVFKFKDGMNVTQDVPEKVKITGNGNFFEETRKGIEQNGEIRIPTNDGDIVRRYSELYSIEIII